MKKTIKVKNKTHLQRLIKKEIKSYDPHCDLNHFDVSDIRDMSELFMNKQIKNFNGDISNWNTSNVQDMRAMFYCSLFNSDISNWDTSNVINMAGMFMYSHFDGDISGWDISSVVDMSRMFQNCPAPRPYWAQYENIEPQQRVLAIAEYQLALREK